MSLFGKQYHFCAACGKRLYDDRLSMKHPSLCYGLECFKEYEKRYYRMVIGKDADVAQLAEAADLNPAQ
jgi:hypothetical protein